ncbi:MAG: thermonuclease family protein [Rhodothermales bacterium]
MRKMLTFLLLSAVACSFAPLAAAQVVRATAVIDGDRLVLDDGSRIRLAGVDAPERHPSPKMTEDALAAGHDLAREERLGAISAAYMAALVRGKPLVVDRLGLPEAPQDTEEEVYEPALVYVADERGRASYELNARMLADGYARLDFDQVAGDLTVYVGLYREAKMRGLGLWAPEPGVVGAADVTEAATRPSDESDPGESACTTHTACIWVTADSSGAGPGTWESRPGTQCPCAGKPNY